MAAGNVVDLQRGRRLGEPGLYWSISALAQEFGKSRATVKKALADLTPDAENKGNPVWLLGNAAARLFGSPEKREQLDDFTPKDRRDWIASERDLLKLRTEAAELIGLSDHREQLAMIARAVVTHLDTLPDVLEREVGLSPDQIQVVSEVCDRVRQQIYDDASA